MAVITTEDKDGLVKYLLDNGINAAFHYPVPCHLQKAYGNLGHKVGDFLISEYLATHCISLPMYPELQDNQVDTVIDILNKY